MTKAFAFFLACFGLCFGQTGAGNIQGTVKDLTGAVVPQARVTIVHTSTNREYQSQANEVGFFLFPSIGVGEYQLTATSSGMDTWKGTVYLRAGQAAVVDPELRPATTATAVTVAGDVTPLVTTSAPTVATVLERERIEQLPLNGRQITTLLYMTTPGVESGSVPRNYGLRYATELLQDGAVLENREYQQIPARQPGLDTIAEFRAEVNNSSAKLNRPGTFMITTRSGTNDVHGALFETARNSGLGVARARTDYYTKPPHLVRNEFGASVGGPVFVPKAYNGKNKSFFFFAYEGYRLMQANTRTTAMQTAAMRQGDFSGLADASGRRYTIYDPWSTQDRAQNWSRLPFTGNQIPLSRQTPLAKYLYSITPLPTTGDNPLVTANYFGLGFNNTRQFTLTTKIDHRLSDKDQLTFRVSHNPSHQELTSNPYDASPTTLDKKANAYVNQQQNNSGVANWTHTFSPTFFGETLVTVSRDYEGLMPYTGSEEISSQVGLPNPFNGIGFPRIPYTLSASAGAGMSYDSSINTNIMYAWIYNFDQNFTKILGRHEFQFGGRFRREKLNTLEDIQIQQGELDYNAAGNTGLFDPASGSSYSVTPFTGHVAANFFIGYGTYQARFNRTWFPLNNNEVALYFQDNFKVTSRLTLNLGVRWEYVSPVQIADNTLIGFDRKNKAVILPQTIEQLAAAKVVLPAIANAYAALGVKYETPQQAGLPASQVYRNVLDFGPRLGVAYQLGPANRPIVLRGGYSIFGYPESLRIFQGQMYKSIPSLGNISNDPNSAAQSPDGLPNYLLRSAPAIIAGVNSANALGPSQITGISRGSGVVYFLDPHQPTSRAHEFSLLFERELPGNTVVKTGMVGTHGTRMGQFYSFNDNPSSFVWFTTTGQPLPTGAYANVAMRPYDQEVYGTVQQYGKTGWSNCFTYQFEVEHRYSKGYAFQAFYVMSNAMRAGGDGWRDDILTETNLYLPGVVPSDPRVRDRLLFYRRDTAIPKHRFNWNFLVDLPFGQGKLLGGKAGRALNAVIGGWQVAGFGQLYSRYFQLSTGRPITGSPIEYYGKKYPIRDCRSGVCYDGWLMWNGYIPANRINSHDAVGRPNGVMGVPSNYKPYATPLIPWGTTTLPANAPPGTDLTPFFDGNTVWVPLKNGTIQRVSWSGLDPMQNQFVLGPMLWNMSASMFKTLKLTERAWLRFNVDFLNNVFNMPGTTQPSGSDGVATTRNSANSPRVLQLTLRLTF